MVHIGTMFDEMNQYPDDTSFMFHGEGLIQEMVRGWVKKPPTVYHPLAMVKDD
jgi:hypothetical protein